MASTIDVAAHPHGIHVITLSREREMNTLSLELIADVREALDASARDPDVRVVVITGKGRAFCCGAELSYYTTARETIGTEPVASRNNYLRRVLDLFTAIETLDRPCIAAINGFALGGGAELALACDFRVMADNGRFGFPEVSLGAIPGGGGVQKLHRFVGRGKALEMVMLGRKLTAAEAEGCGLVYRSVPAGRLMEETLALAGELARMSPVALAYAKAAVNLAMDVNVGAANLYALDAMTVLAGSRDQQEGMRAFFEKRPPRFPGFSTERDAASRDEGTT